MQTPHDSSTQSLSEIQKNGLPKAVFLGAIPQLARAYPKALREVVAAQVSIMGEDIDGSRWRERISDLSEARIVLSTWGMPVLEKEFLEAARKVEAVFYAAGSVKGFATPEAYERGLVISSAWAANAVPVAEFSLASILLSLKRFWTFTRKLRETKCFRKDLEVPGAYLSKVGLVSLGAIGKLVAKKLSSFDLHLLAYDPYADAETAQDLGVSLIPLEELFCTSDVVSIHTPWLPETQGLIDARLLRRMKHGATLINTSRGAVIHEHQLCEVLAERPDLTAILDVTHPEPPSADSPLFTLPNVLLTPHIAGSMDGEVARMGHWMVEELARYLANTPLKHAVSLDMLPRMA